MTRTYTVTSKGRALADKIGTTDAQTCSRICRAAKTYERVQESLCNGPHWAGDPNIPMDRYSKMMDRWQARTEKEDKRLETLLARLVGLLGPGYGAVLSGDPRGCVVKVKCPDGRTDDWGREGICVE